MPRPISSVPTVRRAGLLLVESGDAGGPVHVIGETPRRLRATFTCQSFRALDPSSLLSRRRSSPCLPSIAAPSSSTCALPNGPGSSPLTAGLPTCEGARRPRAPSSNPGHGSSLNLVPSSTAPWRRRHGWIASPRPCLDGGTRPRHDLECETVNPWPVDDASPDRLALQGPDSRVAGIATASSRPALPPDGSLPEQRVAVRKGRTDREPRACVTCLAPRR